MIRQLKFWLIWLLLALVAFFIPKPKGKKAVMDWSVVRAMLKEAFGEDCVLFLVDSKYKIPTLESIKTFLAEDKTDLYKYVSEWLDCDDFSFRLMGQFSVPGWSDLAFGIATSNVHAYNCMLADDNGDIKVYIVEPQTDLALPVEQVTDEAYKTRFVMM